MTEFSFLSVPILLRSMGANETLGGGRREDLLAVPFVSRVGTDVVSAAASLMFEAKGKVRTRPGGEQIFGRWLPPSPSEKDKFISAFLKSFQRSPNF